MGKKYKYFRWMVLIILVAGFTFVFANQSGATVIMTGICFGSPVCSGTALDAGETITVNDKLFSRWSVDPSSMGVTGLDDQIDNEGINVEILIHPEDGMGFSFEASVVGDALRIKDWSILYIDPLGGAPDYAVSVFDPQGGGLPNSWQLPVSPGDLITIDTSFPLRALEFIFTCDGPGCGPAPGASDFLPSFDIRVSQIPAVPEPSTMLLLSGGLLGLLAFRRKFRK
jgi:hypothetical protein